MTPDSSSCTFPGSHVTIHSAWLHISQCVAPLTADKTFHEFLLTRCCQLQQQQEQQQQQQEHQERWQHIIKGSILSRAAHMGSTHGQHTWAAAHMGSNGQHTWAAYMGSSAARCATKYKLVHTFADGRSRQARIHAATRCRDAASHSASTSMPRHSGRTYEAGRSVAQPCRARQRPPSCLTTVRTTQLWRGWCAPAPPPEGSSLRQRSVHSSARRRRHCQ